MDIRRYKETELKAELDRRKKRRDLMPQPLENVDFKKVKALCIAYIEAVEKNRCVKESEKQSIITASMEAVYGKEVWKWINESL